MTSSGSASLPRCLATWVAASGSVLLLWVVLAPDLGAVAHLPHSSTAAFDAWLLALATVALAGCACWWWLAVTFMVATAAAGRWPARPAGCPRALHRLVIGGVGLAVVGGLAAPASADGEATGPEPLSGWRPTVAQVSLLRGLPLPDRAESARPAVPRRPDPRAPASARPDPSVHAPRIVTIRSGDSLWALAARDLPADASDTRIAARWHRIYRLNRDRIGSDPDLLAPGGRLRIPATPSVPREERP